MLRRRVQVLSVFGSRRACSLCSAVLALGVMLCFTYTVVVIIVAIVDHSSMCTCLHSYARRLRTCTYIRTYTRTY